MWFVISSYTDSAIFVHLIDILRVYDWHLSVAKFYYCHFSATKNFQTFAKMLMNQTFLCSFDSKLYSIRSLMIILSLLVIALFGICSLLAMQ